MTIKSPTKTQVLKFKNLQLRTIFHLPGWYLKLCKTGIFSLYLSKLSCEGAELDISNSPSGLPNPLSFERLPLPPLEAELLASEDETFWGDAVEVLKYLKNVNSMISCKKAHIIIKKKNLQIWSYQDRITKMLSSNNKKAKLACLFREKSICTCFIIYVCNLIHQNREKWITITLLL